MYLQHKMTATKAYRGSGVCSGRLSAFCHETCLRKLSGNKHKDAGVILDERFKSVVCSSHAVENPRQHIHRHTEMPE